jgi:hypothetical protein
MLLGKGGGGGVQLVVLWLETRLVPFAKQNCVADNYSSTKKC